MRRAGRIDIFVVLLILTAMVGCRLADRFKIESVPTPVAKVLSVRLVERGAEGVRIEITVKLTNPGELALPLVGANYTVKVADQKRVAFTSQPNRTLPAGGSQTVVLPAALAVSGRAVRGGAAVSVKGSIVYEPPGEIRLLLTESKVPLPMSSFQHRGRLE
jgi:LEA14-like dessication related protein